MNEKFLGWRPVDLEALDHVIIDGLNVCIELYVKTHTWRLGGEYERFYGTVKKFFTYANFKKPIVVFDGTNKQGGKLPVVRQRRKTCIEKIRDIQDGDYWDLTTLSKGYIFPPLIVSVFIEVLEALGIEYHVADGEADREIAALANHYESPVLGSDSDNFIYNLEHGFIHFDRLLRGEYPHYICSVFQRAYSLKQHELLLVIPATFGKDKHDKKNKLEDFEKMLTELTKYNTCEEYLKSTDNPIQMESFESYKKDYSDLTLPQYYISGSLEDTRKRMEDTEEKNLPEWVLDAFKKNRFPTRLLNAYKNGINVMPQVVEAIKSDSAWKTSRSIRQFLYGFMGIRKPIKECIRADCDTELTDEKVDSRNFKIPVSIHVEMFQEGNTELLSGLVLAALNCKKLSDEDWYYICQTLPEEWRLPIAATFYWYRKLHDPPSQRHYVKSLLINFLTCSGEIPNKAHPLPAVTINTKEAHLEALHVFAKWQCVYSDALALNDVARQPFQATGPSHLYSGKVAMHYATNVDLKGDRFIVGESWELYNTFLYLVTGCDEEGKKGKHIKLKHSGWQVVK
jgi:hypothetical protein